MVSVFFVLCLPLFQNPVGMAGILVCISLSFVSFIALTGSSWFSYVLFLVYVGGLLVLFMYICLVSSNHSFYVNSSWALFLLGLSFFISLKGDMNYYLGFLGASNFSAGQELVEENYLSLFLFLGVVLLLMLLVVVRASGAGSILVSKMK
uniref:NADH dehydrogenase subunit 6 n=1 Tax=Pleurobranchaea novaezealandiae TaxID=1883448 RepID=A0A1C9M3J2_9GAST|nr:NADH dehydrogenase subunit 6 [Pleurobranchaea novaezealandiae]